MAQKINAELPLCLRPLALVRIQLTIDANRIFAGRYRATQPVIPRGR